jgi:hypothetical protein
MSLRKIPPALKHAIYSATAVLPGEDPAEFDKLRCNCFAEYDPKGALEEDVVDEIARLIWRKKNLSTLRIAEHAGDYCAWSNWYSDPTDYGALLSGYLDPEEEEAARQAREQANKTAEEGVARARRKIGVLSKLVDLGKVATFDGLRAELALQEQINAKIEKCLKRLALARGVKSISASFSSSSQPQITGPAKAA